MERWSDPFSGSLRAVEHGSFLPAQCSLSLTVFAVPRPSAPLPAICPSRLRFCQDCRLPPSGYWLLLLGKGKENEGRRHDKPNTVIHSCNTPFTHPSLIVCLLALKVACSFLPHAVSVATMPCKRSGISLSFWGNRYVPALSLLDDGCVFALPLAVTGP